MSLRSQKQCNKVKVALTDLLEVCRHGFPELDGLAIEIYYRALRPGVLGQTRLKKIRSGSADTRYVTVIEISRMISGRVEECMYVIIHELVHILRAHPFGKRHPQHEKDFEREVQERLNRVLSNFKHASTRSP